MRYGRIIKCIARFQQSKWCSDSRIKVLIYTSTYYSKESWEMMLSTCLGDILLNTLDIVYCSDRLCVLRHAPEAEIGFFVSLSRRFIDSAKRIKLVYVPYLGVDYFSTFKIPSNISLVQPPPFAATAIAEYCLATSIALQRSLHFAFFQQYKKKWRQGPILVDQFQSIKDSVIGVLGVGRVGEKVSEYYKQIGCKVIGCDLNQGDNAYIDILYHPDELHEFLQNTDILIITLPLNLQTKGIIGINELKCLGNDGILINVSRGETVKRPDLLYALKNNVIKGAVLDVFDREPLGKRDPFYSLTNVIITPHIAGNMNIFREKIQLDFLNKVKSFIDVEG